MKPLHLIVVGAGEVFEKFWFPQLQIATRDKKINVHAIVEVNPSRLGWLKSKIEEHDPLFSSTLITSSLDEALLMRATDTTIFVILTPDHYPIIRDIASSEFRNIVVEKPPVSRDDEIQKLETLMKENNLKMYMVDQYLPKAFTLYAVATTEAVYKDDPRFTKYVSAKGQNEIKEDIYEHFGDVEGVSVAIIEGGTLGTDSLTRRPWLKDSNQIGGMLRDLGTHAFSPVVAAGWLNEDSRIYDVSLSWWDERHHMLDSITYSHEVDMYVSCLLGNTQKSGCHIPIHAVFGKVPQNGGNWSLVARGSRGMFYAGLRSNQPSVIVSNRGKVCTFYAIPPMPFVMDELLLYFNGYLPHFDGNVNAILTSLKLCTKLRNYYMDRQLLHS